jgi:hypothetical protein
MTPEDQKRLATCTAEIAEILHRNSDPSSLDSLKGIEQTVRQQMLEQLSRQLELNVRYQGCLNQSLCQALYASL